jgi:hypothetical protein
MIILSLILTLDLNLFIKYFYEEGVCIMNNPEIVAYTHSIKNNNLITSYECKTELSVQNFPIIKKVWIFNEDDENQILSYCFDDFKVKCYYSIYWGNFYLNMIEMEYALFLMFANIFTIFVPLILKISLSFIIKEEEHKQV